MVKELDDLIDEAYQNGVRSGALAQEKKNREELTKTIKFLHDEVYEQGKREGAEEARKKPRYKTQFNDVPFVPSCDCSSWDDCRSEAYKEGYADAIEIIKKCLALLLIKSDDVDYSFNDGHWGLVFSVFAKEFGLKDTEVYQMAEQLKEQTNEMC